MRMSDILLFGPPLVLGAFGWGMVWFSERSDRKYREQTRRQGPAE